MNFASYDFWSHLAICVVASQLLLAGVRRFMPLREVRVAKLCLLATGLFLMASESWLTLAALLWVVGFGWLAVITTTGPAGGKRGGPWLLVLFVLLQLAPLLYYKYWGFIFNELLGLEVRVPSVLIPMGLSFHTFQTIGYWVDSRKPGAVRTTLLDFLCFSTFFPQIVAGPIEKKSDLLPQLEHTRFRFDRSALEPALCWIMLGLFYKMVLADNLAGLAGSLRFDATNAWHVWLECLTYAIRIYFDFGGYSFIAVGLGLLFGIKLTLNFQGPYWSADLRDFWRRWHITLGTWLRDYVYLPLGGRRSRRWALNVLVVFVVSGIWHGAGWGFILWGLLHGLGVAFCGFGKPWPIPVWIKGAVTFAFVVATWLFFFETDNAALLTKATTLLNPFAYGPASLAALPKVIPSASDGITFALLAGLSVLALGFEGLGLKRGGDPYRLLRRPWMATILVALIVLLSSMEKASFIYFNF